MASHYNGCSLFLEWTYESSMNYGDVSDDTDALESTIGLHANLEYYPAPILISSVSVSHQHALVPAARAHPQAS
ncbi:MAG: hypothetical protein OEX12_03010 [Gammaproteobacteria bacterium]|nr:hypothetical protein [Gammaproteobacteria bacterium]